jgi:hypothetical protein
MALTPRAVLRGRRVRSRYSGAVDRRAFIERARSNEVLDKTWPGVRPWQDLVEHASAEEDSPPVSAAVWEALWRVDPELAPHWMVDGPEQVGPELGSPNPYLQPATRPDRTWVGQVAEVDIEAADLLATAIRAEQVGKWWNPEGVLQQHAIEWAEYVDRAQPAAAAEPRGQVERVRPEGFASFGGGLGLLLDRGNDPDEQLVAVEEALTRLLLVGHPATTQYVLPELLAFSSVGSAASTAELQVLHTALERFSGTQRVQVTAGVVRALSRTELMRRDRPPEIRKLLADASGPRHQATTVVLAVAGGLFRSSVTRRRTSQSSRHTEPTPV